MLRNLGQPWLFIAFVIAFGVVSYFASNHSISRAIFGGLAFAALMSLWREWRNRRG